MSGAPETAPHAVLCVVPKRFPGNALRTLLAGYQIATAESWSAALREARRKPFDLYVVYSPLGWSEATGICGRIRAFDPQTPIIVYAAQRNAAERRAAFANGCAQAYVARSDDAHNLAGTAGQLVMIAELRNMDAMKRGVQAIEAHIAQRLARLERRGIGPPAVGSRSQTRLKIEACRLFGAGGGSRANFERLWPAIYESALKRLRELA